MASEPVQQIPWPTIKDRNVATPSRVKLTKVELEPAVDDVYDVEPITGTVVEEGTPINKDLFEQIKSYVDTKEVVVPLATTQVPGIVQPDGASIKVSAGNISVPTASASELGLVKADNATITNTAGTLSARVATGSATGVVKPDGSSITVDADGTITAHTVSAYANHLFIAHPSVLHTVSSATVNIQLPIESVYQQTKRSTAYFTIENGGIKILQAGWYRLDMTVCFLNTHSTNTIQVYCGITGYNDFQNEYCVGSTSINAQAYEQVVASTYRYLEPNEILCLAGRASVGNALTMQTWGTQLAVQYIGAERP